LGGPSRDNRGCGTGLNEFDLAMRPHAVHQIKIDKALVRNINFFGHFLEILDHISVQSQGDRLAQPFDIRIGPGVHFGQVVFFSHIRKPCIKIETAVGLTVHLRKISKRFFH
jgi:hypothetical protein